MTKIGLFIDGHFYMTVNSLIKNTYNSNLDLKKVIRAIEMEVTSISGTRSIITESHFFKGRSTWNKVKDEKSILSRDRFVDSLLLTNNITPHFQPLREIENNRTVEKGVDVDLACTVMESIFLNRLDWVAIFAGDSDFTPLLDMARKRGVRTLLMGDRGSFDDKFNDGMTVDVSMSKTLAERADHVVMLTHLRDVGGHSALSIASENYLLSA